MKKFYFSTILVLAGMILALYSLQALSQEQNTSQPLTPETEKSVPAQTDDPQTDLNESEDPMQTSDEPLFDQKEALIHFKKGVERYQKRNYKDAVSELEKAIGINPDYKEAYYLLGYAYYKEGKMEPSRNAFNQAYDLDNRYSPLPPK